jgi:hypothetical protein
MKKEKITMTDTDTKTVKQKALAHFKQKISGDLFKYHVEEWKADVYYRATANMATESRIMALTAQGKTAEALVESIVLKSLDQDGNRLFQNADKVELMQQCDPNVIVRLATKLNNANAVSQEEVEKN